jgi:hypothetical protein
MIFDPAASYAFKFLASRVVPQFNKNDDKQSQVPLVTVVFSGVSGVLWGVFP